MDAAQERSGGTCVKETETSSNENLLHGSQRKRSGTPRRLQLGTGKYANLQGEPSALWPDSNADNLNNVPDPVIKNAPAGKQQQSTSTSSSTQTFTELNDALTKSLLWKPTIMSSSSPLFEFLSYKKGDGNKPKGWLRNDLDFRSKGHLTKEENEILTAMYLSLSGTTPFAASTLAFVWGQTEKTMRSVSKKHLQIIMTKGPSGVAIGCLTEQKF